MVGENRSCCSGQFDYLSFNCRTVMDDHWRGSLILRRPLSNRHDLPVKREEVMPGR